MLLAGDMRRLTIAETKDRSAHEQIVGAQAMKQVVPRGSWLFKECLLWKTWATKKTLSDHLDIEKRKTMN
jgi:hypothetical protein